MRGKAVKFQGVRSLGSGFHRSRGRSLKAWYEAVAESLKEACPFGVAFRNLTSSFGLEMVKGSIRWILSGDLVDIG